MLRISVHRKLINFFFRDPLSRALFSAGGGDADSTSDPVFGLEVPTSCPHVPAATLIPKNTWPDATEFDAAAANLAGLFAQNFENYHDEASEEIRAAGPRQTAVDR